MSDRGDSDRTGDQPGSVFGNLPDSRPGRRSPRRDAAAQAGSTPKRAAAKPRTGSRRATAKPRAATRPLAERRASAGSASQPSPDPLEQPSGEQSEGGLEDLAWAGVAAAAGVATAGVRFASRAIEALRGGAEPR